MASVKDLVTSGLFAHGSMEGMEVSGSSGHPMTPQFKFGGSFIVGHGSTEDMGKNDTRATKRRKRGAVIGSDGGVGMGVERLLGPC